MATDHLGPDDRHTSGVADGRNNPLVRNPKLAALLEVPPAILVAVLVGGTLGIVIALVLVVVGGATMYWVFKQMHDRAFGPGGPDSPAGSTGDQPQGPIVG